MTVSETAPSTPPASGTKTDAAGFEDFERGLSVVGERYRVLRDGFTPRSATDMALRWAAVHLQDRDREWPGRHATTMVTGADRPEWLDLGYALFMVAAKVNPGTEMLAVAVGALAGAGKQRADTFKSIELGVDLLLQAPLKVAETYLSKAAKAPTPDEQDHYLRKAQDKLVTALHHARTPYQRALAEASLGLVELLLGSPEAEDHLLQAQRDLETDLARSLERVNSIAVLKGWRIAFLFVFLVVYYPIYWIPSKTLRAWKAERAVPSVQRQVALLGEIEAILTPGEDAPQLELRTSTAHYRLSR